MKWFGYFLLFFVTGRERFFLTQSSMVFISIVIVDKIWHNLEWFHIYCYCWHINDNESLLMMLLMELAKTCRHATFISNWFFVTKKRVSQLEWHGWTIFQARSLKQTPVIASIDIKFPATSKSGASFLGSTVSKVGRGKYYVWKRIFYTNKDILHKYSKTVSKVARGDIVCEEKYFKTMILTRASLR